MKLPKRPKLDWLMLQTMATALAALVSIALSLYTATRAPIDLPARLRVDQLRQDVDALGARVRWLEDATQPTPQHPGRR